MKTIAPHEPQEELLSVDDAFEDAQISETRWQAFESRQRMQWVLVELPDPVYQTLERLAQQQQRTVPVLIERVIEDLVGTFAPAG